MSLEIREMILRTTLTDDSTKFNPKESGNGESRAEANINYIIAECVERIMERLREENER